MYSPQARDKSLLLMERLQMVEPLVTRQPGANLRNVSAASLSFPGSQIPHPIRDKIVGNGLSGICLRAAGAGQSGGVLRVGGGDGFHHPVLHRPQGKSWSVSERCE